MYILVSYLSFFARLLRLYQIIINSTLYFELEFKKKTASNRALVRGGARGAVAPPSFWDLLNRISKMLSISRPLLGKKKFRSPKFIMLTRPLEETNIRILVAGVLLSYVTTTLMCEPIY